MPKTDSKSLRKVIELIKISEKHQNHENMVQIANYTIKND